MMSTAAIVKAVRSVVGLGQVGLHVPSIGLAETESMNACMARDPVSYYALDAFQVKVAEACGVEQSFCVSSGTAALHLALLVTGVEAFQEVLVPAMTFVATANAVAYCGAIPNFIDVRSWDLGVNPFKLGRYLQRTCEKRETGTYNKTTGRKVAALIVTDLLGVPAALDELKAEAGRWGLPVIEDAAEALGSRYKGRPCGSNGHVGVVSFNNNKIVTTNGGGALLTDDPFTQAHAWELGTTARVGHPWRMGNHTRVAYNYRMGNINAALGQPQLDRLEELVAHKQKLHAAYLDAGLNVALEGEQDSTSRWNCWLIPLTLDPLDHRRDEICAALHAEGIAGRTLFTPLHELPMYKQCPRDNLEGTMALWRQTICLPSSPKLGERL